MPARQAASEVLVAGTSGRPEAAPARLSLRTRDNALFTFRGVGGVAEGDPSPRIQIAPAASFVRSMPRAVELRLETPAGGPREVTVPFGRSAGLDLEPGDLDPEGNLRVLVEVLTPEALVTFTAAPRPDPYGASGSITLHASPRALHTITGWWRVVLGLGLGVAFVAAVGLLAGVGLGGGPASLVAVLAIALGSFPGLLEPEGSAAAGHGHEHAPNAENHEPAAAGSWAEGALIRHTLGSLSHAVPDLGSLGVPSRVL
ncbi:MAG: hypothetical protein ACYTFT_17605, partial [Planctomycetota bacterium]